MYSFGCEVLGSFAHGPFGKEVLDLCLERRVIFVLERVLPICASPFALGSRILRSGGNVRPQLMCGMVQEKGASIDNKPCVVCSVPLAPSLWSLKYELRKKEETAKGVPSGVLTHNIVEQDPQGLGTRRPRSQWDVADDRDP